MLELAVGRLRESGSYRQLLAGSGKLRRLPVPAAAWVCTQLAIDLGRPLLVIAPHESEALAWAQAARLVPSGVETVVFPAPALTPYQAGGVPLKVATQEVEALGRLAAGKAGAVVTTVRGLFARLPPSASFRERVFELEVGSEIDRDAIVTRLLSGGYQRVDLVATVGEVAVRGGVIDLFPVGAADPVRLELFGDEIEAMRYFDPITQRSAGATSSVQVLPTSVWGSDPRDASALARHLVEVALEQGEALAEETRARLVGLEAGEDVPGWSALLPVTAATSVGLWRWLEGAVVVALDPPTLREEVRAHGERLETDFAARRDWLGPGPEPERVAWPVTEVLDQLGRADVELTPTLDDAGHGIDFGATLTDVLHGQLPRLPREVDTARRRGERVVVVALEEEHERLRVALDGVGLEPGRDPIDIVAGEVDRGFHLPAAGLVLFGEGQLLGGRRPARGRTRERYGPFVASLRDLKVGDYVVHADHGIGQFTGLKTLQTAARPGSSQTLPSAIKDLVPASAAPTEVMEITYQGGRTLLLPLTQLDQIQRYSGLEGIAPRLDQLGGSSWNKTREKVRAGVRKLAFDLVRLYAERAKAEAPKAVLATDLQHQFDQAFAWEETDDQLEAIEAIESDLESGRPMDRLLCGDVGFGKTEVAMRAAFKAVDNGWQVAVLAPTTILADQHLETFRKRFDGFPVSIEAISRFRSPAEIKDILARAKEGRVDILIGTHRLLSKDVELPKLGLLVVDEEQRFGVAHKEKLKQLKRNLHVLAMSATPVPRTLQLSLAKVRELSLIETPPRDRLAVETAILGSSREVVREAIEAELERGGQVFYVTPRVEGIEELSAEIRETVPGIRLTVAHGQLDEKELSRRMHAFTRGDYDLLLATTIIENGIHIPRVNTMLVHSATSFGLSQLYQLRGRVGRGAELAYCYLLIPPDRVLGEVARKRLAALKEFSDLGAGFRIAARDLEIRGAGDLLGAEQSGHIAAVGIETYMKILEEAIRELSGESQEPLVSTTFDLPVPMSLPTGYVSDPNLRMEVYRRIATWEGDGRELLQELEDRFGRAPTEVRSLIAVATAKRRAEQLRIQAVLLQDRRLVIRLRRDSKIDVDALVRLVSARAGAEFTPEGTLLIPLEEGVPLLEHLTTVLEEVAA